MKGVKSTHLEKTTSKKPNLIRVNISGALVNIGEVNENQAEEFCVSVKNS